MNTKHKPATALPWLFNPHKDNTASREEMPKVFSGGSIESRPSGFSIARIWSDVDGPHVENAAYICHTSNAYPQMVQVLKDRAALPEGGPERALLSKLGEA